MGKFKDFSRPLSVFQVLFKANFIFKDFQDKPVNSSTFQACANPEFSLASTLRGYIFQKLLLAWKFSCINKNCFFVKETDTFGHIVVWTTYTSHIDHFTPQHTAFEQSTACLSVFLELLPGLILLTMLWHAGWTLEKTICMNMTYNYSTTIFRSILTQILCISGIIYNFSIWPWKN